MTITTIQKVIKIGDSAGVTLPAKDLKRAGIKLGEEVKVSFERITPADAGVLDEYAAFKAQYGEALQNLASR